MKIKSLTIVIALLLVINAFGLLKAQASDEISKNDFFMGSFSKTIDLFDYTRKHAEAIGGTPPPAE